MNNIEMMSVSRELLIECLGRMEADWDQIDGEWGPTKGGLEADIANGRAEEIRMLRAVLKECQIPPDGWYCTRGHGHDGPCAAYEECK